MASISSYCLVCYLDFLPSKHSHREDFQTKRLGCSSENLNALVDPWKIPTRME